MTCISCGALTTPDAETCSACGKTANSSDAVIPIAYTGRPSEESGANFERVAKDWTSSAVPSLLFGLLPEAGETGLQVAVNEGRASAETFPLSEPFFTDQDIRSSQEQHSGCFA